MACSPGGRFLRLSLIFKPFFAALSSAVPTFSFLASLRSTLVLAANSGAQVSSVSASANLLIVFMPRIISFSTEALLPSSRDVESIVAGAEVLAIGKRNAHAEDAPFDLKAGVPEPFFGSQTGHWTMDAPDV